MVGEFFLDHGKPASLTRRLIRVLLVISFCSIFYFIGFDELTQAKQLAAWITTPCVILTNRVDSIGLGFHRDMPYHVVVTFAYRFAAKDRSCETEPVGSTDIAADAYAACKKLEPGTRSFCYVDPQSPSQAVLSRMNPHAVRWFIAATGFATAAIIIFYCIPQVFFYQPHRLRRATATRRKAITLTSCVGLFEGFGIMSVLWLLIPLGNSLQSRNWQAVDAVIAESNLISTFEGGDVSFMTYRSDILFQYQFAGETFYSNCYNVTEGATLFGSLCRRFIKRYASGQRITCYVDSANPTRAVLTRHISIGIVYGLWPALLAILGGMGIIFGGDEARINRAFRGRTTSIGLALAAIVVALLLAQIVSP